jgi:hypothetical protein
MRSQQLPPTHLMTPTQMKSLRSVADVVDEVDEDARVVMQPLIK